MRGLSEGWSNRLPSTGISPQAERSPAVSALWAVEAVAWWSIRRSEDREFVFIHDKLIEIDGRISELQAQSRGAC